MININIKLSPGAQNLLKDHSSLKMQNILKNITIKSGEELKKTIQLPGYAPVDTGKFRSEHNIITEGLSTYLISPTQVSNGQYLWKYIVGGHRVLTTEKSRRWWFWHLKHNLGGNYTRKTKGPPGYVPPDNYPQRALETALPSLINIAKIETRRVLK